MSQSEAIEIGPLESHSSPTDEVVYVKPIEDFDDEVLYTDGDAINDRTTINDIQCSVPAASPVAQSTFPLNLLLSHFSPFRQLLHLHTALPERCDCPGGWTMLNNQVTCSGCVTPPNATHSGCHRGTLYCDDGDDELDMVCLTCRLRMCHSCVLSSHRHAVCSRCQLVPYFQVKDARTLFTHELYGEDLSRYVPAANPLLQQSLSAKHIARVASQYFSEPRAAHEVRRAMLQRSRMWGDAPVVTLSVVLEVLAELHRLYSRASTDPEVIVSKYHRLGALRWLYNLQCWVSHSRAVAFPLFRDLIAHAKGKLGANAAHTFLYARWVTLLNVLLALMMLLLIVPSLWDTHTLSQGNARGILVGDGLLDSFFFYGGYLPHYTTGWDMRVAYILVSAAVLGISLIYIVASFNSHKLVSASTSATSLFAKDSPAAQLFAAFPFSLPSERSLRRYKTAMLSRIRDSYINAPPPTKKTERKRSFCAHIFDGWYWAFGLSIFLIGGAAVGMAALHAYLHDGTNPRIYNWWDSPMNPIFLPLVAAFTRRFIARLVSDLARYEWSPLDYSREHRRSRLLWRIMFLETVFAAVPAYIAFTASRAVQVVPFIMRPEAIAQNLCIADASSADGYSCTCDQTYVGRVFYVWLMGELVVSLFTNVVGPLLVMLLIFLLHPCISQTTSRRWRSNIYGAVEPVRAMGEWAHRQILMWAGLPFAPIVAPMLALGDMIILAASLPLTIKLANKPPLALTFPVARQQQHSRICTLAMLLLSFVSVTIFLASRPTCGPFLTAAVRNLSISEYFNTIIDTAMPRWVAVSFEYLTNAVVLWLAVIVLTIYLLTISVQTRLLKQRKQLLELQLRAEERNKRLMISKSALTIGLSQLEGKRLFEEWFSTLPPSLNPQRPALARLCAGDLLKFLRMTPEQLLVTFGRHSQLAPHARTLTQSILMMRLFANTPKEKVQ